MENFFKVTFLSHETADCFLLRIGNSLCETHILIDGGLSKDVKKLLPYIEAIKDAGKCLDLVIVTHVDNDHIGGILTLFRNDLITKKFVKEVWFNGKSSGASTASHDGVKVGFEQGNKLSNLLDQKHIPYRGVTSGAQIQFLNTVCEIRVLAPSFTALQEVNADWETHDSLKVGHEIPDHDVPWETFRTDDFDEDKSSKNRSSIVVLVKGSASGKTAIFSGDSVPSEILQYIPFPRSVDLFKIPHHGSKSNTNRTLIERIRAKHYIVPAGRESKKPHKKMLHTLLSSNFYEYRLYLSEGNWAKREIPQHPESKFCKIVEYSTGFEICL